MMNFEKKFILQTLTKCDFLKGRLPKYFFPKMCSSGGKQAIHKVSAASIFKNCHTRTSLNDKTVVFNSLIITSLLLLRTHGCKHCQTRGFTVKQN